MFAKMWAEDPERIRLYGAHVGLVRSKAGTGGQAVRYAGEWDLPPRPGIAPPATYRGYIENHIRSGNSTPS
ncbi:hypothetical protein GCM10010304_79840 [Streptomyces roseoviolaceus]